MSDISQIDLDFLNRLFMQNNAQSQQVQQMRAPQTVTFYNQAVKDLSLTPQEQYLYQHHLDNLMGAGKVMQPNGDISTILQTIVTGPDGRFYNIPTVWGGKELAPPMASEQAAKIGWDKWPSYDTPDAADARYGAMHDYLGKDVAAYMKGQK